VGDVSVCLSACLPASAVSRFVFAGGEGPGGRRLCVCPRCPVPAIFSPQRSTASSCYLSACLPACLCFSLPRLHDNNVRTAICQPVCLPVCLWMCAILRALTRPFDSLAGFAVHRSVHPSAHTHPDTHTAKKTSVTACGFESVR